MSTIEKVGGVVSINEIIRDAVSGEPEETDGSEVVRKVEREVQSLSNTTRLINGLYDLAKGYPATADAVVAFKAFCSIKMTKRENDSRILVLYVAMRDIMTLMMDLKNTQKAASAEQLNLKDLEAFSLEDQPPRARLRGHFWQQTLATWVDTFIERKIEFERFMPTTYSATSTFQPEIISNRLKSIQTLFEKLVLPNEQKIAAAIDRAGGSGTALQNDSVLLRLMAMVTVADAGWGQTLTEGQKLENLKSELCEHPEDVLQRNLETLTGKWQLQTCVEVDVILLALDMDEYKVFGTDDKASNKRLNVYIRDPEMRKIWADLKWQSVVEIDQFVLGLHAHYKRNFYWKDAGLCTYHGDRWALAFLSPLWGRPIMEPSGNAFAGFVTWADVNKLMDMRPLSLEWSIPRWLAYSAVGWRFAALEYVTKISAILNDIRATVPDMLPRNKQLVGAFLKYHCNWIGKLVRGISGSDGPPQRKDLLEKFREMIEFEEERLGENLERIQYDIDSLHTLTLVLDQGEFGKTVFFLIYLLLRNARKIFDAETDVFNTKEFFVRSWISLDQIRLAVHRHASALEVLLSAHDGNFIKTSFSSYAFGMLREFHS
ncbi:uncharacterized protein BXZ73DRAFT_111855 [Epithele typhae]|uniref:uncharacterized protein n=1 Tax=Epithele typhae TaxID=378194 RepID=UPI0020086BC4|nr:uncharacterized protein BXZ73DRAFT_111855 [Epithele typhae]KAH9895557.1 hypothetical protein BXZ73DRAFT_111855 [Epithele typhae]